MLDREGNLPLHVLIGSGCNYSNKRMKMLIDIEPKALETRDGVRGLYPFMSAASCETKCDLDTVYELLRQTPHLVARCGDRARREVVSNEQRRGAVIMSLAIAVVVVTGFMIINIGELQWKIWSDWITRTYSEFLGSDEL